MLALQPCQQSRVGGGKLVRGEIGSVNPLCRRAIERRRFAGKEPAKKEFQADGFSRIVVRNFLEQFAHGNFHAKLLADFANKTLLEAFARLAFAAGEFPQPAEMRVGVPLRDEELARAEDERGADFNDG